LGGIAKLSSPKFGSNSMAKGKISINITQKPYAYIDGATGEELTREEFFQRASGLNVGRHRIGISSKAEEGEGYEDEEETDLPLEDEDNE